MALRSYFHVWRQGLAADRPATPAKDMAYFATDTGQVSIYDTGAAAWFNIGFAGLAKPVTIPQGGTGQTTPTEGFDALAPTTTKGDLIVYGGGTDNVRIAVGADRQVLQALASATPGVQWSDNNVDYCLFGASQGTTYTWTPGNSYSSFGGTGQVNLHKMDFTRFKEARIHVRGFLKTLVTGDILVKIVDTTHSVDITEEAHFVLGTDGGLWKTRPASQSWQSLNVNTTGVCEFEAQAYSDDDVMQQIVIGTISLELR